MDYRIKKWRNWKIKKFWIWISIKNKNRLKNLKINKNRSKKYILKLLAQEPISVKNS